VPPPTRKCCLQITTAVLRKLFLTGLATLSTVGLAHAMSTVEIFQKAKPCVVTIRLVQGDEGYLGTGFFVDTDKIITDAHVLDHSYASLEIQDLNGNFIEVDSQPLYFNRATDLAVLKVTSGAHQCLTLGPDRPSEGETVTVVGNPQGYEGSVSTGVVSAIRKGGDLIQFTAPISNGSSGGPLLDEEGRVIGIVQWAYVEGGTIVENLNFAAGVPLIIRALNTETSFIAQQPQPTPQPTPPYNEQPPVERQPPQSEQPERDSEGLVIPKTLSQTVRYSAGYNFRAVLDQPAIQAISNPVYAYIVRSAKGTSYADLLFDKLDRWFNLRNCTVYRAIANDAAYFKKWPQRTNYPNVSQIAVEQVVWSGAPCYLVTIPYKWAVSNGKKAKSGEARVLAYVMPGHHKNNNRPDYFVAALWNEDH
jgi:serine protease Do